MAAAHEQRAGWEAEQPGLQLVTLTQDMSRVAALSCVPRRSLLTNFRQLNIQSLNTTSYTIYS